MKTPLQGIEILSTYMVNGKRVLLPKRMATCTPDTSAALSNVSQDVEGKGDNLKPYQAMAASAILAIGVRLDRFGNNQDAAAIQAGLIRLGNELGNIDGSIGKKTRDVLERAGVSFGEPPAMLSAVEDLL